MVLLFLWLKLFCTLFAKYGPFVNSTYGRRLNLKKMKLRMPLKDCGLRIITLKMQSCLPGHVLIIGETFKKYLAGHYTQNCKEFQKTMLRLLHTTHKTAKNAVIFHTHYNFFFTTATIIFTVSYMSNDFLTVFLEKSLQFCV